jgi:hypothetical protein
MERRSEAPDATIPSGCESLAHLTWHEDEATKIVPKVVKPQQMNSQFPATHCDSPIFWCLLCAEEDLDLQYMWVQEWEMW